MWGIPPAGTPAAAAFWLSFWPAFWSGMAYSLFCGLTVGLVVGVVVVRFQHGVETRAAVRTYAREWALKLNPLRRALAQADVIHVDSAVRAIPVPGAAALQVLEDAPLPLWRESLGKKAPAIDHALTLQKRGAEFNAIALAVDTELHRAIRTHNYGVGTHPIHDSTFHQYAVGKLLSVDDDALLPWLAVGAITDPLLQKAWEAVQQSDSVVGLGGRLRAARASVFEATETLRLAIDA
jgi:hypothetical protein